MIIRCVLSILLICLAACDRESGTITQQGPSEKDSAIVAPVRVITAEYIELEKIERISKFRSGIGHDYRDDAESCRSMKHYYQPKMTTNWSGVKIFSPVSGTIVRIFDEWAGTQIQIRPFSAPMFTIIIFHVAAVRPIVIGDTLLAGEQIGTHIGSQTMSDIALFRSDGNKRFAVSYFDGMNDSLFNAYILRGAGARSDFIISQPLRDGDPLNCSGESFGTAGTLENWVTLK